MASATFMEITVIREDTLLVAVLSGRLDSVTSSPALTQLNACVDGSQPRLLLDASLLEYVSSAGLRTLLGVAKKVRAGGGKIGIYAMKDNVREIFEISGFHSIIPSYPDGTAARTAHLT